MDSIFFKKQTKNQWRRDDCKAVSHVDNETMYCETEDKVNAGWRIEVRGGTLVRAVILTPPVYI